MKSKFLTIILLSVLTVALFANDKVMEYLRAESNGKNIIVTWKLIDESNVSSYAIERAGTDMSFEKISSEYPKGFGTSYKFVDESAFKNGENEGVQSKNTYYYRIVIENKDNSKVYSDKTLVTHNTSSIRRTWGMLKEMFR